MGFWDWLFGKRPTPRRKRRVRTRGTPPNTSASPSGPSPAATPPAAPNPPRPAPKTLSLDLGKFKPLSRDEVSRHARGINPWGGVTDRPSRIPPISDKRTQLIDRAMVGRGLISPERLVEIHKLGEEMDRLQPSIDIAHHQARLAVEQDREARKQLKAQKKAEAAERARKHAEDVAHRRATDIVFLGRGVSAGLADRRPNTERLEALGLPLLATPAEVASALDLTIPHLRWLAFHNVAATTVHYVRFEVPKRSGGMRTLASPHKALAKAQTWILENILTKVPVHHSAHGFVPGRSTVTNARPHVGARVVVNTDLSDFFGTVTFPRVKGLFAGLGYSPAAATILALLATEPPRRPATYGGQRYFVATGPRALPQGACTSPAVSNLVTRRLDARLSGIAAKLEFAYTRYADDITFSSKAAESETRIGYVLARIRHISQDEGFRVNEKKTRVQRRHTAQEVTGIVVNDRTGAPRKLVRRLRAILHKAKSQGLAAQNREGHPNFEGWVRGMIAYIAMVNPEQAVPLQRALADLN